MLAYQLEALGVIQQAGEIDRVGDIHSSDESAQGPVGVLPLPEQMPATDATPLPITTLKPDMSHPLKGRVSAIGAPPEGKPGRFTNTLTL